MFHGFRPYVPVAQRRQKAACEMAALRQAGVDVQPVQVRGKTIAGSFWGQAWCRHLEHFADFANRLPRGVTYLRNGSVCHLALSRGRVEALVSGSRIYRVEIAVTPLAIGPWNDILARCRGQIGSLLDLLAGRLSGGVMKVVTDPRDGLFPQPREMKFSCTCPDWADMCKHVAAVLYGIGARLDQQPELLFTLRGVDHLELLAGGVEGVAEAVSVAATKARPGRRRLEAAAVGAVFGLELEGPARRAPPAGAATPEVAPPPPAPIGRERTEGGRKATAAVRPAAPVTRTRAAGRRKAAAAKVAPAAEAITGAAVVALRERHGLSRQELADLLLVSSGTVGGWERAGGELVLQSRSLAALRRLLALAPAALRELCRRRFPGRRRR